MFHPNVSKAGEICVNTLKKDWKPGAYAQTSFPYKISHLAISTLTSHLEYGIRHVLSVIRCLLIFPNAESALNEEAGMLLLEGYDIWAARAKMYAEIHAKVRRILAQ